MTFSNWMNNLREKTQLPCLSLPALPTIEPVEVHASTGSAASPSGLPIGPGRRGKIIPGDGEPFVAHFPIRVGRTWFDQSLSGVAACVIALGDREPE